MDTVRALSPFVLLALLGGLHCAGMCGGFGVLAAGGRQTRRGRFLARQSAFLIGKATTYSILGLAAALGAEWLAVELGGGGGAERLAGLRRSLAWVAGGAMIAFGLGSLGWHLRTRWRAPAWLSRPANALRSAFGEVAKLPGYAGPLGLGLLTGLLPCGLSWSAIALAAASPPLVGALGCFVFGLGTAPALLLVGFGWERLSDLRVGRVLARSAGPLLILFGLYTVVRGGLPGAAGDLAAELLPECCQDPAAPGSAPGTNEGRVPDGPRPFPRGALVGPRR